MVYERLIDKEQQPTDAEMVSVIGEPLAEAWNQLRRFLVMTYEVEPELQYGGVKYGWSIKHKKGGRPLCELYPEHGSFTALVVLGKKELDAALERLESFGTLVRQYLENSPRYHDGCWMFIRLSDVRTCLQDAADIEQLVLIKKKPPKKKG